jgi:hypothetical protein
MRLHESATLIFLLSGVVLVGMTSTAIAANVINYSSETEFLSAVDPSMVLMFEDFDGFAEGEPISSQVPGVEFSSPNDVFPGFVPVQASGVPQAVSSPNILSGGWVDGTPKQQIILMDFGAPSSALAFFLAAQHPTAMDVTIQIDFIDGTSETMIVMDANGNNNPVEFFGITSDVAFSRAYIISGDEAGGLFQEFGGVDDLRFGIVDENPPICAGNPSRIAGILGIDGTGIDDRLGDTGVASVSLALGAINLSVDIDPAFVPGDPNVSYRVTQTDDSLDAEGTVVVTDGAGNTCELCLNFKNLPEGPTFAEVLCCVEGIVFQISNDDTTPPGAAVCSSAPYSPEQPSLPFGFEPSPEDDPIPCQVFTIESPIVGPTEMVLKKDGDFDPRLRMCFSRSDDGGLTYPPFEDVTEVVEPILDIIPDPTRVKGKKTWSPVKVGCCVLAELCNGLDDDGDGLVDEGLPINDETVDQDLDGFFLCPPVGQLGDCNDQNPLINPAATEICNGMDDDCNGTFDEDNPGGGLDCVVEGQQGVCAEGITECFEAIIECRQVNDPVTESCDELDNDCDGEVDNGFDLGADCSEGVGECEASGLTVCSADGLDTVCDAVPGEPVAELCDGLDNDCDGVNDNGFDLGGTCTVGIGECAADGVKVCSADGLGTDCEGVPGDPVAESCDGLDNDCDGAIDNGFDVGAVCTVGVGECAADGFKVCRTDGSGTDCDAVPGEPGDEVCDGLDNDCDGDIDETGRVFGGYEQPVNADGSSIFNRKSVIPLKFRMTDCAGNDVIPATPPTLSVLFYMDGIVGSEVENVKGAGKANDGNEYRYDMKANKFVYNLSAKTLEPNKSYIIRTTLDDGSTHDVIVSIQ